MSQLKMHDHKSVYLVVRSSTDGHTQSTAYQESVIEDTLPKLSASVYDLPFDYEDLGSLNDYLHSSQLSKVAKQLHNDEVDFSNNTKGISGALQGTSCIDHEWWVQVDVSANCKTDPASSACLRKKYSSNNVVQFGNMRLQHATQYFVCVHASGGSCNQLRVCSNGFIIDIMPPLPGQVSTPNGQVLSDNTSVLVYWEGFQDIEIEVPLVNLQGIKEYQYGLGESALIFGFIGTVFLLNIHLFDITWRTA